jgi:exodeoxyribonuclease-5
VYRDNTQVICGLHRVRRTITQRIRRRLGYAGRVPMEGERVLCCRNSLERGIFNGGQGVVLSDPKMLGDCLEVDIRMDDLDAPLLGAVIHPYLFHQHFDADAERPAKLPRSIDEFDWGYVLTCHKAQGSEWPHVTIVDDSAAFREERNKWLYTALTRASQGLTLLQRMS